MKLTPRAQGCRFRREGWPDGFFIDVTMVGKGEAKECQGIDSNGNKTFFVAHESDSGWIEIKHAK